MIVTEAPGTPLWGTSFAPKVKESNGHQAMTATPYA
jgi:hypothetical protein